MKAFEKTKGIYLIFNSLGFIENTSHTRVRVTSFCVHVFLFYATQDVNVEIITDVYGAEGNRERDYAFSEDMEDIEKGVYLTPV